VSEDKNENDLIRERRRKLSEYRKEGVAFPNDFRRSILADDLHKNYDDSSKEELEVNQIPASVSGRIIAKRVMGKASFIKLQDVSGQIQVRMERDRLPEGLYQEFKKWDVGDIIGVSGVLFKTNTNELTVLADTSILLTKSLRPLPEKFHGLSNQEMRYRQRYVDLIMNEKSRNVFITRSKIITLIREFMNTRSFLEVETPMMHSLPGGAVARPFETHHNTLDMKLFLRIAPELFLKRLVVGGFERVYEINRNFRNEGVSTQHNPEFTMLELYQAYADYEDFMVLIEDMMSEISVGIHKSESIIYQEKEINFKGSFHRMTMEEAIIKYNPDLNKENIRDKAYLENYANQLSIKIEETYNAGKIQAEIFEKTCEENLVEPTFIYAYPTEVSPLSRRNDSDPFITDRFEFFVFGRELANGFSELNDPEDQSERFKAQVKMLEQGDNEAMS
jgi:lysyl-tRNA synthetase class 2